MRNTSCIICGRELKPAIEDTAEDVAPPSGATVFTSRGNYGSTLWDPSPSSGDYLQITVCDKCLSQAAAAGRVLLCEPQRVVTPVIYSIWKAD